MHASLYERAPGPVPNFARYTFFDEDARRFYPDWDTAADTAVAILRTEAGRDPHDRLMHDLVGELATRSDAFNTRWVAHHVQAHRRGIKHIRHPVVGDLTLRYEALEIPNSGGLAMFGYTAEPGSASENALKLLASGATTPTP
jgi:hypothetical protein